jgi:hypothetical protein
MRSHWKYDAFYWHPPGRSGCRSLFFFFEHSELTLASKKPSGQPKLPLLKDTFPFFCSYKSFREKAEQLVISK